MSNNKTLPEEEPNMYAVLKEALSLTTLQREIIQKMIDKAIQEHIDKNHTKSIEYKELTNE